MRYPGIDRDFIIFEKPSEPNEIIIACPCYDLDKDNVILSAKEWLHSSENPVAIKIKKILEEFGDDALSSMESGTNSKWEIIHDRMLDKFNVEIVLAQFSYIAKFMWSATIRSLFLIRPDLDAAAVKKMFWKNINE